METVRDICIPSVLWHCWLGGRKGIQPVKNWVVGCWRGICLERGAHLHMAQLMPLPLTVSCFSKIQIGFTFLVLAHPGSPRQRAVKQVCVRVCVYGTYVECQKGHDSGQVIRAHVPLSLSSIIWYRCKSWGSNNRIRKRCCLPSITPGTSPMPAQDQWNRDENCTLASDGVCVVCAVD